MPLVSYSSLFFELQLKKNHVYNTVKDALIGFINGALSEHTALIPYGSNILPKEVLKVARKTFFASECKGVEPKVAALICIAYGITTTTTAKLAQFAATGDISVLSWDLASFKAHFGVANCFDKSIEDYLKRSASGSHGLVIDPGHVKYFRIHGTAINWPDEVKRYNLYFKVAETKNAIWYHRTIKPSEIPCSNEIDFLYGNTDEYSRVFATFLCVNLDKDPARQLTLNDYHDIFLATSYSIHCVDLTNDQMFSVRNGHSLMTYKDGIIKVPDCKNWQVYVQQGKVPYLDNDTLTSSFADKERFPTEWVNAWKLARTDMSFSYDDMVAHVYHGKVIASLTGVPTSSDSSSSGPSQEKKNQPGFEQPPKGKWSETSSTARDNSFSKPRPEREEGKRFKEEYSRAQAPPGQIRDRPKGYSFKFDAKALSQLYDSNHAAYTAQVNTYVLDLEANYDLHYTHCFGKSKMYVNAFEMGYESLAKLKDVITNDVNKYGQAEHLFKYGHPLLRSIDDYYYWLALQTMGQQRYNDFGSK